MALTASDLAALKSSLEVWEIVEYFSTATVLIGVVGEYLAEFTEFAEKRGIEKRLGKLSTLVLIVGLAVELLGLVRTSQLSGGLIASLEEQSGQAIKEAAHARLEASGFSVRISAANKDAAQANERAKKYEAGIADADARAAEALKVAEQEQLARVKIEERIAWRTLTALQRIQVRNGFCAITARPNIEVITTVGNEEAARYGEAIAGAIRSCGFTVKVEHMSGNVTQGVFVISIPRIEPELTEVRGVIRKTLELAGIKSVNESAVQGGVSRGITILVGPKPN